MLTRHFFAKEFSFVPGSENHAAYGLPRQPLYPYLHHAVKELLSNPSSLLDPRLLLSPSEKLRRLHDADGRVQEIRDGLPEKIRTRAEVGIEDGDEIGGGSREGVPQVPRFLELRTIRSTHVCVRHDGVRE